ncbi:bifunctional 4-hydroxy-2-oxoglutarate aldolase/2-dehydro-3-deoxy-phosphogluconate aldolase [Legionella sp. W05-934-2]|jgi:2-dehydro-3-deoxyphosphogluconate aldolase/(4S)-4-hydroxy-2-oxoglutarate aldolase|uniref:bifunctional 4-hydroxy-2-oxoglutarate aldolase/2-dehydro-3-deoxy-phosphogluconate aldolase n=1 Tax=Legionella sp. W05-934-2 TaxID=1198649 RepID=UPI0034637CFE
MFIDVITFMKEILKQSPIIPVITIDHVEDACMLAQLLHRYGFNTLEITLRTANALSIINVLAEEFSHLTIGAGTVTDIDTMEQVVQSKAKFAVSPGFTQSIASLASMYSLPYLPGVATPSDVMQAKAFGLNCLKLFPAEVVGGIPWLQSIASVFPEISFCPTGGISFDNAAHYLNLSNVISIGMSALTPSHLIKAKDWEGIEAILKTVRLNHS